MIDIRPLTYYCECQQDRFKASGMFKNHYRLHSHQWIRRQMYSKAAKKDEIEMIQKFKQMPNNQEMGDFF